MQKTLSDSAKGISTAGRSIARRSALQNSKRVRNLKIILPVVSLLIILVVIGMTYRFDSVPGLDFESTSLSMEGLVMTEPKLSGSNSESSYKVAASRAIQRISNPNIIDLEKIYAEIVRVGGDSLEFSANFGIFNSNDDSLVLNEGIEVQWSNGYSINLESAEVNLTEGIIKSDNQILVQSSGSALSAGQVEYLEDEKSLKFTDGVKMTINPSEIGNEK